MENDLIYIWLWQTDPEGVVVAKRAWPEKKTRSAEKQRQLTQQYALSIRETCSRVIYQVWESGSELVLESALISF